MSTGTAKTDQDGQPSGPSAPPAPRSVALWAAGGIAALLTIVGTVAVGSRSYLELHRAVPGIATSLTSAALTLIAYAAAVIVIGDLVVRVFLLPRRRDAQTQLNAFAELHIARAAALVWAAAAAALVAVDAADSNGAPLAHLLQPGALGYLFTASYDPGAWLTTMVCACVVFGLTMAVRRWDSAVSAIPIAFLGVLAPIAVGQVLVGPDHDFAGDTAFLTTPAVAIWFGSTFVLAGRRLRHRLSATTLRRYATTSVVLGATSIVGTAVVAVTQVQAVAWGTPTGVLSLVQLVLMAALLTAAVTIRRGLSTTSRTLPAWFWVGSVITMGASVGITQVMWRIPPPVFFVSTTTQDLFFGYNVNSAPSLVTAFADWRINILFFVPTLAAAALYLAGVRRLRRRGDAWPPLRTASWLTGCLVVILTTSSALGPYASASFSIHMIFHMSLNMLGPLMLVMGGPVTLALRATRANRPDQPSGPHEWITRMLHSSLTRKLYNPLLVFVEFVGSYYLIYFTPLFGWAMRYHWAHQLMNVHFLIVGYLFYSLIAGVDRPPRPLPHIGKLGVVLAAMPFHAFFGVIVMTSGTVIGELFYRYIAIPWDTNLLHDQYVAGGIAWAAGELPLIVVVIALVMQWAKQDQKEARQRDRHLDSGVDGSFDAYNEMLTKLNDRQP